MVAKLSRKVCGVHQSLQRASASADSQASRAASTSVGRFLVARQEDVGVLVAVVERVGVRDVEVVAAVADLLER